jgi:type I restriction enzyme, S subunit
MAVSSLGTFVRISSHSVDPAAYPDRHFDLFSIPGFDNGQQPEQVVGSKVGSNKYKVVSECVLVSKINPRIKRIWYVGNPDPTRAVCSTEFVQLVPIVKGIDLRFLEHLLLHADLERLTATAAQAATKSRQRFLPNALLSIPFHLPPLDEQRRIVGLLETPRGRRLRQGPRHHPRPFPRHLR